MGIFTCLTSGEQKCGKTKFKAIDYCRNRAYSTNLKIFTRCQVLKKKDVSYSRPTGRLDPAPADLAYASLELAALEYRARRGEIIVLYEDETILWRFALPRAGWWRRAQRY